MSTQDYEQTASIVFHRPKTRGADFTEVEKRIVPLGHALANAGRAKQNYYRVMPKEPSPQSSLISVDEQDEVETARVSRPTIYKALKEKKTGKVRAEKVEMEQQTGDYKHVQSTKNIHQKKFEEFQP